MSTIIFVIVLIKVVLLLLLTVFSQNCFRLQAACFCWFFFFYRTLNFALALSILTTIIPVLHLLQGSRTPQQSHSGMNTLHNNWMKANTELSSRSQDSPKQVNLKERGEGKIADSCSWTVLSLLPADLIYILRAHNRLWCLTPSIHPSKIQYNSFRRKYQISFGLTQCLSQHHLPPSLSASMTPSSRQHLCHFCCHRLLLPHNRLNPDQHCSSVVMATIQRNLTAAN